jgi:hypothetical protein
MRFSASCFELLIGTLTIQDFTNGWLAEASRYCTDDDNVFLDRAIRARFTHDAGTWEPFSISRVEHQST